MKIYAILSVLALSCTNTNAFPTSQINFKKNFGRKPSFSPSYNEQPEILAEESNAADYSLKQRLAINTGLLVET